MSSLHITTLDAVIVAGYFLVTLGLGLWFGRRKITSGDDLFLANREASWPLIGASLFSANISSQQFVGQAGLAYTIGIAAGAFQLIGAMCFIFLAVFFVDVYLGLKLQTAPEFFEKRYNAGSRLFVSGINVSMILAANITTALYAGATVITDLLGWSTAFHFNLAVGVIALAAGLYTVLGGLRSILWVDLLQATVLILGGAVTLVLAVSQAGGINAVLHAGDTLPQGAWSVIKPWYHEYGWLPMITGATVLGVHSHCTDHDYVQRALAARSIFHSKMGALFAAFLKIIALFIVAAPGVLAARLIPGLAHPDQAYTRLITEFVPAGFRGLVMSGLLAAILGTVAAGLSASSALLVFDFAARLRPGLSDRARVRLGRILMVLVLILCSCLAPWIKGFPGVFSYLVRVWSLLAPPVFVCVVFGIFSRRASSRGAVAALGTGCTLGIVAFWLLDQRELLLGLPVYLRSPLNLSFVIMAICAIVLWSLRAAEPVVAQTMQTQHGSRLGEAATMSPRERVIFRLALTGLLLLLVGVTLFFSPWGVAGGP